MRQVAPTATPEPAVQQPAAAQEPSPDLGQQQAAAVGEEEEIGEEDGDYYDEEDDDAVDV